MTGGMAQMTQTAPQRRNWLKLALGLSVGLNLLVAGAVIGGMIGHDRRMPRPPGDFGLGPLGAAFSPEDRRQMRRESAQAGADVSQLRTELRGDLDALAAALEAEPWNEAAVRAQLAQMHAHAMQRAQIGEQVMLDRLGRMTVDDRRAYAERLRARLSDMGPPDDRGPDPAGRAR